MYTMGYRFKPWLHEEALASGQRILDYVRETAREYDVDRHVRFDHRVVRASWSSETRAGRSRPSTTVTPVELTAGFLWSCAGYYDYEAGHRPEFAGGTTSPAGSCTRSTGRRTSTGPAGGSS